MEDLDLSPIVAATIGVAGVVVGGVISTLTSLFTDWIKWKREASREDTSDRRRVVQELITVISMEAHKVGDSAEAVHERRLQFWALLGKLSLHMGKDDQLVRTVVMRSYAAALMRTKIAPMRGAAMVQTLLPMWHAGTLNAADTRSAIEVMEAEIKADEETQEAAKSAAEPSVTD